MLDRRIKTPCIGVCYTGIGDSVCRGCKRFSHEVIAWNSYTPEQKSVIDQRLSGFLSQCVSNKLQVTDAALLQWQLRVQQVNYVDYHDEYCWVFSLLKAGSSQIKRTADYGFEVDVARLRRHTHIRGVSGAGKSRFLTDLLIQLVEMAWQADPTNARARSNLEAVRARRKGRRSGDPAPSGG